MEVAFLKLKYLNKNYLIEGLDNSSYDVALSVDECVYVAEYRHNRISILNKELSEIGNIEGITSPHGLCFNIDGFLYVSTFRANRVLKFNPDRSSVIDWDKDLRQKKQMDLPVGITVDIFGNVYFTDYGLNSIVKVSADGKFLLTFDVEKVVDIDIFLPHGLVISEDNLIYVADRGNRKTIHVFDLEGNFMRSWNTPNKFFDPLSVRILNKKIFVVCNGIEGNLYFFDKDGTVIGTYGQLGKNSGEFLYIMNLVVDESMCAFIVEEKGNRLQKINLQGVVSSI